MRTIAEQDFKITTITLPSDFETAKASPKVDEIQSSIDKHGLLQRVGIEQSTGELIWGRKRLVAHMRLGLSHVPAKVIAFDFPEEKEIVCLSENLDRQELTRDERALMRARVAELEEQRARREREEQDAAWGAEPELTVERDPEADGTITRHEGHNITDRVKRKPGAPSKGRAEAAKKLGRSPRQLAKDIKRAKEIKEGKVDEPPASDLGVPDHGLQLDEQVAAEIKGAVADFAELAKCLRKAVKLARGRRAVLSDDLIQSIEKDLKAVEANTPAMVCPHCACRPRMLATCTHCSAQGWISKDAAQYVPPELLDVSKGKRVYLGGKLVKASTL